MPSTKSARRRKTPSEDEIRKRAYEIYLERGGEPGRPEDDWQRACQELIPPPRSRKKV